MKTYLFPKIDFTRIGLFILCMVISSGVISAQSLTDKLGGVSTDFNIFYGEIKLDVRDQVIIKRGLANYGFDDIVPLEGAYGYGYGLETFRFEFLSSDYINIRSGSGNFNIRLDLLDADGSNLLSFKVNGSDIWVFSSKTNSNVYSINLQNIPLVILNETKNIKMNIMK